MIDLKIAIIAFIIGTVSWIGVNIFDQADQENTATICAVIAIICYMLFVASIIIWVWNL